MLRENYLRLKKLYKATVIIKKIILLSVTVIIISFLGLKGLSALFDLIGGVSQEYKYLSSFFDEVDIPQEEGVPTEEKVRKIQKLEKILASPDIPETIKKQYLKKDVPAITYKGKPITKQLLETDSAFKKVVDIYKSKYGEEYLYYLKKDTVQKVYEKYKQDYGELSDLMLKQDYLYFVPKTE